LRYGRKYGIVVVVVVVGVEVFFLFSFEDAVLARSGTGVDGPGLIRETTM